MSEKWVLRTELARDDWQAHFEPEVEEDECCDYGNTTVWDETGRTICLVVSAPYSDRVLDRHAKLIVSAPEMEDILLALVSADSAFADVKAERIQAAIDRAKALLGVD